jgi:hypothetical protein
MYSCQRGLTSKRLAWSDLLCPNIPESSSSSSKFASEVLAPAFIASSQAVAPISAAPNAQSVPIQSPHFERRKPERLAMRSATSELPVAAVAILLRNHRTQIWYLNRSTCTTTCRASSIGSCSQTSSFSQLHGNVQAIAMNPSQQDVAYRAACLVAPLQTIIRLPLLRLLIQISAIRALEALTRR